MRTGDEADLDRNLELPYLIAPALRQRLDLIHHLLEFGNQIVLIEGDAGSGRTRMLECICSEAEATWTVLEPLDEIASPETLLRFLAEKLSIPSQTLDLDIDETLTRIRETLAGLESDRYLCVLVIDDAERLSDDLCALLFTLAHAENEAGELRMLLAGRAQAELSDRLQRIAPAPSLIHLVDIPPLNTTQTDELMEAFAQAADQDGVFAALDHKDVALAARGNPAATIAALNEYLDHGSSTDPPASAPHAGHYPRLALLSLVLLIGAAAVLYFGIGDRQSNLEEREIALPDDVQASAPAAAVAPVPVAVVETVDTDVDTQAAPARSAKPSFAPPAVTAAADDPLSASAPSTATTDSGGPDPNLPEEAPTTIEANVSMNAVAAPPAQHELPSGASAQTEPRPEREAELPFSVPVATPPPYSRQWVLTRDPQSYVLQFIGVRQRDAAERFLRAHDLASRGGVIELTHEGAPWYVVVFGHFSDREAAVTAIKGLAPDLAGLDPWARPIHSLRN